MRRQLRAVTFALPAWIYLGLGALATLVYTLSTDNLLRAVLVCGIAATALAAILFGIRRYRPEPALPWYVFATALGLYGVGWVFWEIPIVREGAPPVSFSLADLFSMPSYFLFAFRAAPLHPLPE